MDSGFNCLSISRENIDWHIFSGSTGFWLIAQPGSLTQSKCISVNLINQPNHIKNWSSKLNYPGNLM